MKVLISPESIEEALSILHCDIDILDVKNTKEGSLGAQFPWNTKKVVEATRARGLKTSATLGDLPYKPGTAALAAFGCATLGVTYVKAGLHGATTYEHAFEMMNAVRQAVRMVSETADVVASGYADWRRFGGLQPDDLVRAARDAKCQVVMVDTAIKDGKNLFDNMTVPEIKDFVRKAREAGMTVALAGSIKAEHASLLFDINPDIIGVRGAVCEGKDRTSRISPEKTNAFCQLFHRGSAVPETAPVS
jgi:uncharacterized protein (UPF0264 family)